MKRLDYKWRLLAFLFVAFFLELGSRQLYSAALPQIRLEFLKYGVTNAQLGAVGTVFGAVFGLALMASGLAADLLGRKRVLVAGTILFSVGIFGSGFAKGIGEMMLFYGIMNALGQCCIAPASYALISKYHVETRSTAMAIFQGAVYSGIILSSLFGGILAEQGEGVWRWAFWIMGAGGVAWAVAMQFGLRPEPVAEASGAEKDEASVKEAFFALLKKPTAVLIAVAFGFFMYGNLGLRLWMPMFMTHSFEGVGTAKAALHGVLWLNLFALASCILTAKAIDKFGVKRPRIRLEVSALGFLLCIAPVVWVAKAGSFGSCCVALSVLGLTVGVYDAAHYPAMFDCIAPRYRSAATGITGCMAFLMGSLAPLVLGWMSDCMSMRTGIASLGAFYLVGAIVLLPAMIWFFERDRVEG
ncbi:MAG: MFS transporter [Kiritimatiellae bacterium]|nr:MFS transporter [Kiritimatiellia bacterium]